MKSATPLAVLGLALGVTAQSSATGNLTVFEDVLQGIEDQTETLGDAIAAYTGGSDASIVSIANALVSLIEAGVTTIDGQGDLDLDDSANLGIWVLGLIDAVNATILDLIANQDAFADNCYVEQMLQSLQQQYDATSDLSDAIEVKVNSDTYTLASELSGDILSLLDEGIAAFQTLSEPASCTATTTSSVVTTTSSSSVSSTSSSPSNPTGTATQTVVTTGSTGSSGPTVTSGSTVSSNSASSTVVSSDVCTEEESSTSSSAPTGSSNGTSTSSSPTTTSSAPVGSMTDCETETETATTTSSTPVETMTNCETSSGSATGTETPGATETGTWGPTGTETEKPAPTATGTETGAETGTETGSPAPNNTGGAGPTGTETGSPAPNNTGGAGPTGTETETPEPTNTSGGSPGSGSEPGSTTSSSVSPAFTGAAAINGLNIPAGVLALLAALAM